VRRRRGSGAQRRRSESRRSSSSGSTRRRSSGPRMMMVRRDCSAGGDGGARRQRERAEEVQQPADDDGEAGTAAPAGMEALGGSGSAQRRSGGPRTMTARRDHGGPIPRCKSLARPCAPLFLLFLADGGRGRGHAMGLEDELAAVRLGPELCPHGGGGSRSRRTQRCQVRSRVVRLGPDPELAL
jgi:hypothetical protein